MGKLDKMMDASKIIKYTKDTLEKLPTPVQPKKNKAGFFDYLSLSYWFEKAGNLIDPVSYVEDAAYKAEYNKVVAHMQSELNSKVAYQVSLQQKLRNIKDKEEVKKLEKQTRHQLEEQLEQVGISTAEELRNIGSKAAWLRIQEIDESACINRLMALEGAIQGVKKTMLSDEVKADLKEFYQFHKK